MAGLQSSLESKLEQLKIDTESYREYLPSSGAGLSSGNSAGMRGDRARLRSLGVADSGLAKSIASAAAVLSEEKRATGSRPGSTILATPPPAGSTTPTTATTTPTPTTPGSEKGSESPSLRKAVTSPLRSSNKPAEENVTTTPTTAPGSPLVKSQKINPTNTTTNNNTNSPTLGKGDKKSLLSSFRGN